MCISCTEWSSSRPLYFSMQKKQRAKLSRVQLHRLSRRKRSEIKETKMEMEMEMRNLKLYMENMSILVENQKLRKKASVLHQENIALMSEFQKKFSKFDRVSTKDSPTPKFTK
ncbi:unnamed protein product [Withania somnifera]